MNFFYLLMAWLFPCLAFAQPPRELPSHLLNQYTMSGTIPIIECYIDNSYQPTQPRFYSKETVDAYIERVKIRDVNYYGETDIWLYQALEKYPIHGKDVVIVGSVLPWYESIICAYETIPLLEFI